MTPPALSRGEEIPVVSESSKLDLDMASLLPGPDKDFHNNESTFDVDGVPIQFDPEVMKKMKLKTVEETIAHCTEQLNDPTIKDRAASSTPVCTPTEPMTTVYTCRKCRCLLFLHEDLMTHTANKQTFSYKKKKKDRKAMAMATMSNASPSTSKKQNDECGVHFLHSPTEWMSELEGKIHCPKCKTRLGSFSWSGSQCSCGSWITPSTTTESTAAQTKFDPAQIKELAEMGFDEPLIKIALEKNKHIVQDAMTWLFSPEAMDFVQEPSSETQHCDY